MSERPCIALLTDFGHDDHYVGVLHAVLEREAWRAGRISWQRDASWARRADSEVLAALVRPSQNSTGP